MFCVLIPSLLIQIDETNLLQEVHWFYSHLTFFLVREEKTREVCFLCAGLAGKSGDVRESSGSKTNEPLATSSFHQFY